MIISPGRRYIFAHMPKTGGTSVATALEDRAMKDDILIGDTPKAIKRRGRLKDLTPAGRLWKHSTLADIDGIVSQQDMADWFVFSLVRNPWDRMVSYYHWLQTQTFTHPAVTLARTLEFDAFVLHSQTLKTMRAHPVSRYTTDQNGVDHADVIVRVECLDADMEKIWDHLGFRLSVPHLNRSQRLGNYRRYYDRRTIAAVATASSQDIARFGYIFDKEL